MRTIGVILVSAIAAIAVASTAAADESQGAVQRFCAGPTAVVADRTRSVTAEILEREIEAVQEVVDLLAGCISLDQVWVGTFSGTDVRLAPLTAMTVDAAVRGAIHGPGWSDPAAVVVGARRQLGPMATVIVVMDGMIEIGPRDGPPADSAAYIALLASLDAEAPTFVWSVRPSDRRLDESFESEFGPLQRLLAGAGLGALTRPGQPGPWQTASSPGPTDFTHVAGPPQDDLMRGDPARAPDHPSRETWPLDLPGGGLAPPAVVPEGLTPLASLAAVVVIAAALWLTIRRLSPVRGRAANRGEPAHLVALQPEGGDEQLFLVPVSGGKTVSVADREMEFIVIDGLLCVRSDVDGGQIEALVPDRPVQLGEVTIVQRTALT
jgi:hypothetical protein